MLHNNYRKGLNKQGAARRYSLENRESWRGLEVPGANGFMKDGQEAPKKPNLLQNMKFRQIFADTSKAMSFAAGTSIFEKGDKAGEMYVVKEGEVDIFIDGFHLETVSADGIFGELSLIDLEARIASAKARTDCTLQVIDKRHFLFLVQETPMFAIQVMKLMADRLRRMDLLVAKSAFERAKQDAEG